MKKPLLFDGAFGTYYYDLTQDGGPCELANIQNPQMVEKIHGQYLDAGATAIKTNTFSVYQFDAPTRKQIVEQGYLLAKNAAKDKDVYADIGYINDDEIDSTSIYAEVAEIFLEQGADRFLFETFASYEEAAGIFAMIKQKKPSAQIVLSFAVSQDGYSRKGHDYKDLLRVAQDDPNIDMAGLNCVCGPGHLYHLIKDAGEFKKPFIAMPNAGYPTTYNGRILFRDNAGYFSDKIISICALGAAAVGGCCGTTPKHIRACAQKLALPFGTEEQTKAKPLPQNKAQTGAVAFATDKKLIAVELDPPLDSDCAFLLSAAADMKTAGADYITVADSPLARTRADSVITAAKVKRECGIDVIPHLSCRDKNHIGLKGTLLGAAMENIDKILIITGDPVADTTRSRGVYGFNSYDLIALAKSLGPGMLVGGALNVNAVRFEKELERAKRKMEKGANFFLTQPIFTDVAAQNFLQARKELDCILFAGILPIASYKNALFLNNEVSGIDIPRTVIDRMQDKTQEQVYDISIAYCRGVIEKIYTACDGFYLMTPLKKTDLVAKLIKEIKNI